jgi:hypothetical protein
MQLGSLSLKHLLPLMAIGLMAAGQASATTACADSVLSLVSVSSVGTGGSPQCTVNTSLPGLTLYTDNPITAVVTGPSDVNKAATPQIIPVGLYQVSSIWNVQYLGGGPATTSVSYDVILGGNMGQFISWAIALGPEGGPLSPVGGGATTLTGATEEFSGTVNAPVSPGTYTFDVYASSNGTFSVDVPANSSVDIQDPRLTGAPEPASLATLTLGLAAGFLVLRRRSKKQ